MSSGFDDRLDDGLLLLGDPHARVMAAGGAEGRTLLLSNQVLRLIRLELYRGQAQLALDLADALLHLPADASDPLNELLNGRLTHITDKYPDHTSLQRIVADWRDPPAQPLH